MLNFIEEISQHAAPTRKPSPKESFTKDNTGLLERQKDLTRFESIRCVCIGCGGGGFWASWSLAISTINSLFILVDPDTIDVSNLNRLPYPQSMVGFNKAKALKLKIDELERGHLVAAFTQPIEQIPDLLNRVEVYSRSNGRNILIDATDNLRTQKFLQDFVYEKESFIYLRIGFVKSRFSVSTSKVPELINVELGQGRDYGGQPVWLPTALIASGIACYIVHNLNRDRREIDINSVNIHDVVKSLITPSTCDYESDITTMASAIQHGWRLKYSFEELCEFTQYLVSIGVNLSFEDVIRALTLSASRHTETYIAFGENE